MPSKPSERAHRWRLNYADTSDTTYHTPPRPPATRTAMESNKHPPGFPPSCSATDVTSLVTAFPRKSRAQHSTQSAYQSAWAIAFSPLRTLITSAFALFMTPASVQLFSIASVIAVLLVHLRALISVREVFRPLHGLGFRAIPHLILYLVLCAVGVFLALRKADRLGVLPTTQSDWVGLLPYRIVSDPYLRL